ncbi:MAG: class I SAM-dependent methyltransferase, partial [Pseudomonadota bacterium]
MTPAARVQAAIEILARWQAGEGPAERLLASWGRANRYAGSGDRRAVADRVYGALRQWRSAGWASGAETPGARDVVLGYAALAGEELGALFDGSRHGPAALTGAERSRLRDLAEAPRGVRLDLPDWLLPETDGVADEVWARLRHRAPVDLRVNRLKTDPAQAAVALTAAGIETSPVEADPDALRVTAGAHRVQGSDPFRAGLVELQDASSQAVVRLAGAAPDQTVLDFCAGGGGKTLALAAHMANRGALYAHDISAARLQQAEARAARAG